ncbi:MAG TPA: hypothetical protein VNY83_07920 [Solirubrobacterales bacterium]|jgi:hypothetical protein|nr:hypothetical protein [Solirubrobacterales bacterium]
MAQSGERRMVFDIRGRRKHVVRVVYAILALLMGASLFLVVGPVNIGGLLGNNSSTSSAASLFEEQAATTERKLKKSPEDPSLLLSLTRTRISAANALTKVNPTTGQPETTPEARTQFEKAGEAWSRYLKQAGGNPSPSVAQLSARALFSLAETSTTGPEAEANIKAATQAQQIFAEAQPSLGAVSTLAIYKYFAFDFAGGEKEGKRAQSLASSKSQKKEVEKQLAEVRKRAKSFQKQVKASAKATKGSGKEALKNPLGGLSGSSGSSLP